MSKINFKKIDLSSLKIGWFFNFNYTNSWIILIVFFSFLNIGIWGYSIFLFFEIDKGQAFVSELGNEESYSFERLDRNELVEIINYFEEREEKFNEIEKGNYTKIIDPSL